MPTKNNEPHHPDVPTASPEPAFDAYLDADSALAWKAVSTLPEGQHESLVRAWTARNNATAIDAIANDEKAPKVARKAARRALGILKARGVALPSRHAVASMVAKPEWTFEARMLYPDGRGVQVWWIARISTLGRTEVVEIQTSDRDGLVSIERGNPTAGNLKQLWASWGSRAGRSPVPVPLSWARYRIMQARLLSQSQKAILPMGLDAAAELLGAEPHNVVAHPIDQDELALPTEEGAVKARIEQSMQLHSEPEFGAWMPEDRAGIAFLTAINEKIAGLARPQEGDSAETVADLTGKIDAAVNLVIEEASDAYFDDQRKGVYVSRLKDAALSLEAAGMMGHAIDTLLLANAIKNCGVVSNRPSEIPFVRGMFLKLLAVAQQRASAMAPNANAEAMRGG
jgi:hypothetical protein